MFLHRWRDEHRWFGAHVTQHQITDIVEDDYATSETLMSVKVLINDEFKKSDGLLRAWE